MWEDLVDALNQMVERKLSDVNTNMPATVISYDAAKNRAVVKPVMPKRLAEDDPLPPPQIVEVPIVWPASGGGNASFTMPLKPGDGVMLAVQQRSIENWLGGSNGIPDDPRQFDLSDCVAIAGCSSGGTVAHDSDVVLKFNKMEVRLKPDNSVRIGNDQGSITIDSGGKIVLHGSSVRVETPTVSFNLETHRHQSTGAGSVTTPPLPS